MLRSRRNHEPYSQYILTQSTADGSNLWMVNAPARRRRYYKPIPPLYAKLFFKETKNADICTKSSLTMHATATQRICATPFTLPHHQSPRASPSGCLGSVPAALEAERPFWECETRQQAPFLHPCPSRLRSTIQHVSNRDPIISEESKEFERTLA